MPTPDGTLPADVLDALRRGQHLEAIKLLREATGIGLKEAKEAVDAHLRGEPARASRAAAVGRLPPSVASKLQRGDKIEAIKLLRERTGLGLKEAKDWIEASPQRHLNALRTLSPGEVPRSGNTMWWLIALVIAGAAAYSLLSGR
jgi:ribosomal protein L7/L12